MWSTAATELWGVGLSLPGSLWSAAALYLALASGALPCLSADAVMLVPQFPPLGLDTQSLAECLARGPRSGPRDRDRVSLGGERYHLAMATKKTEDGIRAYLETVGTVHKPVVDREAVKALKAQIKTEADPIAKLRLLTALEDEEAGKLPDTEGDKAVFVAQAKEWADAEGITVSAFQALRVPDDVLREAGFDVSQPARPGGSTGASGGGSRAPRIPFDQVAAAAKKLGSGWKLTDLAEALGRDTTTVRNYANKLVSEGIITVVGDDPKHDGRGRAPKIYAIK